MRTILTQEDIKNIFEGIFTDTENDETILIADDFEQEQVSAIKFLNTKFYCWRNRVLDTGINAFEGRYKPFESWLESLNESIEKSFALVEITNEETTRSEDFDSGSIESTITFLIQTNKLQTLDYYCRKLRNTFLGKPIDFTNVYGDDLKAYLHIGVPYYDEEPTMTPIGEVVVVSIKFLVDYLNTARAYRDTKISICLDKDSEPLESEWEQMPFNKATWQAVIANNAVPTQANPHRVGSMPTSVSLGKTFSFYDFNKSLTDKFNNLFWELGCVKYIENGQIFTPNRIKVPVWIKVESANRTYFYKDIIVNMEKVISNGDFNICSINLKGSAK